jgi:ubiquitin carboxyl-terminal hydrolase 8
MWSGQNPYTAADELKREVSKYAPQFNGYAQRDAHEFLIALLDGLQDEMMKTTAAASGFTVIEQLFNIQMISQVTCHACRITGSGTESIKFLSLPLPEKSNDPITLSSLLDLFEKEEELDGQIYCDSCGQIARGRQKTSLDILPPIIIVQLKRFPFDGTYRKVTTIIDYPLTDFDFYRRTQKKPDHLYDLIAVSMHSGSLASGHYTAYVRHDPSKKWYYINDEYFERVADSQKIYRNSNAYVLIYAKKTVLKY